MWVLPLATAVVDCRELVEQSDLGRKAKRAIIGELRKVEQEVGKEKTDLAVRRRSLVMLR